MSTSPVTLSSSYPDPFLPGQSTPSSSAPLYNPAGVSPQDTVQLSQLAQIQQMAQQGDSAAAIASTTGLTLSEIDSDLGISNTASTVSISISGGNGGGHAAAPAHASASASTGSALSVHA